ncbi:MAG: hypothetical protein ACE14M_04550 [Terriglobales bacterium]
MNFGPNHPSGSSPGGRGKGRRGRRPQHKRGSGKGAGAHGAHGQHAGIYSAPMDHSYRAALHGQNGNSAGKNRGMRRPHPGYGTQYLQPDPEPLPLQVDAATTRIFAFVDDMFFLAKIQETARKLNVKVEFVKSEKDIFDRLGENGDQKPSLIIFDLNNTSARPLTIIPKLKSKLKKDTNIIGFLSHVQGDLKVKAQQAGCDMVLPRSAFSQNLPQLLRRHGAAEEQTV